MDNDCNKKTNSSEENLLDSKGDNYNGKINFVLPGSKKSQSSSDFSSNKSYRKDITKKMAKSNIIRLNKRIKAEKEEIKANEEKLKELTDLYIKSQQNIPHLHYELHKSKIIVDELEKRQKKESSKTYIPDVLF